MDLSGSGYESGYISDSDYAGRVEQVEGAMDFSD
jgi:hypothetical protein